MTNTIKKSIQVTKFIKGYSDKFLAYREAWTRIKESQEQGFYLEAITIEESIISDRLSSYFRNVLKTEKQPNSLKGMQDLWKKHHPEAITSGGYKDLIFELDKWREERNQSIHAIVQSHTHPERSIDSFLLHSKNVAARGEKLTSAISRWCDKKIRASKQY
jgi:hypothetical protein